MCPTRGLGGSGKALILGLFAKRHRTDFSEELTEIIGWLASHGCQTLVDEDIARRFSLKGVDSAPAAEIPARADAIVVFGGDGTLLSVARLVKGEACPILGVNLGSLGFLTEVTLDRLYSDLSSLISGQFELERRCMLEATIVRKGGEVEKFHALNDVVINKAALARVISVDAYFNDQFIANFVADGIILSTPTGSTAYSLSAGGPIVYPSLESILITPICPHTLTNRPLIIPANSRIRFALRSGKDVMLTIDGQIGVDFSEEEEVICTQSPYTVELIRSNSRGFFDVLREKLKWGRR